MYYLYIQEIKYRCFYLFFFTICMVLETFYYSEELLFLILIPYSIELKEVLFLFKSFFEILWNYIFLSVLVGLLYFIMGILFNVLAYSVQIIEKKVFKSLLKNILGYVGILLLLNILIYMKYLSKFYIYLVNFIIEKNINIAFNELELSMYNYILIYIILGLFNVIFVVFSLLGRVLFKCINIGKIRGYRLLFVLLIIIFALLFLPSDSLLHLMFFIIGYIFFDIWAMGLCVKKSCLKQLKKKNEIS